MSAIKLKYNLRLLFLEPWLDFSQFAWCLVLWPFLLFSIWLFDPGEISTFYRILKMSWPYYHFYIHLQLYALIRMKRKGNQEGTLNSSWTSQTNNSFFKSSNFVLNLCNQQCLDFEWKRTKSFTLENYRLYNIVKYNWIFNF